MSASHGEISTSHHRFSTALGREGKGDRGRRVEDDVLFLIYIHVHVVELTISSHFCSYTVERPAEETMHSIV